MSGLKTIKLFSIFSIFAVGCASTSQQYFDSAMNDRNRAPASLGIPANIDMKDAEIIDSLHNQAKADYLFLKSEMESAAGHGADSIELLKTALIYDPSSPTLMQKLSVEYYKAGNVQLSLHWAEKAYEVSGHRRDVALLLAGLNTTNKNYDASEVIYKKLVQADPKDMESLLYLGAVYTEKKNYPKAVESFKAICADKDYPSKHLAHYYLARVYAEQAPKKTDRVKAELKLAMDIKPDFFEAVSMMGQYIQKEKGLVGLIKFYESVQKEHVQPKIAEVLSQYYITTNQYDKAYQQLEILDDSNDDSVQVKLKMALILIDKKIYDRAISKLEEILAIAPDSDKVRFYLSAVHEERHEYQDALAHYLKIEKDSGYYEEARLHAAYISKVQGQPQQGIEYLKEIVPNKAENPQTFIFMSQLFEDQNDMKNSLAVMKQAEEKFSSSAQVYYHLGMVQDKMNLKSEMITSMKKVIELEPEHSQALNYLAYSWAEQGEQLDKAETYARRAVAKEKNDPFIMDTLGWVLYKKGEYKQAAEVLEKAHKLQSDVGIIAEHLGETYAKMNLNQKAFEKLQKAQDLEADQKHKGELQVKITQLQSLLNGSRTPSSAANDADKKESP
jgi:tetratricopeptide (TPR) repeat protein